jgi:hypothetical protein
LWQTHAGQRLSVWQRPLNGIGFKSGNSVKARSALWLKLVARRRPLGYQRV